MRSMVEGSRRRRGFASNRSRRRLRGCPSTAPFGRGPPPRAKLGEEFQAKNGAATSSGTRTSRPVARSRIAQVVLASTRTLPSAPVNFM